MQISWAGAGAGPGLVCPCLWSFDHCTVTVSKKQKNHPWAISGAQSVPYLPLPVYYALSWLESARHSPKPSRALALILVQRYSANWDSQIGSKPDLSLLSSELELVIPDIRTRGRSSTKVAPSIGPSWTPTGQFPQGLQQSEMYQTSTDS
jgi:hypothetical protein